MDNPHDVFFQSAANLAKEYLQKRKAVQTDKDRSESGREKELARLDAEYKSQFETLRNRYQHERVKIQLDHEKTLNPKKPLTILDRFRMKMNKAPGMEHEYFDDDGRTATILESNQALRDDLRKFAFMNIAGRMTSEELAAAMDKAFESGNQSAVENFAEVAYIRGDEFGIKRGQGYIDALKEQSLTPSQKIARVALKRLNLYSELFDYGVKQVLEGREFVDLRGGDTDKGYDMELAQIKTQMKTEDV